MAVAVIGAGPAGCAAAYVLARRGLDPLLIEAQNSVGGRTRTDKEDGFIIDTGGLLDAELSTGPRSHTRNGTRRRADRLQRGDRDARR